MLSNFKFLIRECVFHSNLHLLVYFLNIAVVQQIAHNEKNGSMPFNSNTFDVESLIVFYNSLQFKQFWQLLGVVFRCLETGVVLQTIFSTNNIFILNK